MCKLSSLNTFEILKWLVLNASLKYIMTFERKFLTSLRFKGDYLCNTFAFLFEELYSILLCEKNQGYAVTRLKFVLYVRKMYHVADSFEIDAMSENTWSFRRIIKSFEN